MTQSNQYPSFLISQWGDECFPIKFQVEPEFGLAGYLGILKTELNLLNRIIDKNNVGKDGEVHAKVILDEPEIYFQQKTKRQSNILTTKTMWEQRYARNIKDEVSRKATDLFFKTWNQLPISAQKQHAYTLLTPHFTETKYFLCLEKYFWLENRKFIKNFYSHEARAVIADIEIKNEPPASLRVPLLRSNMTSLVSWLSCQNICTLDNYILVINSNQYDKVMNTLRGTMNSRQRVLLLSGSTNKKMPMQWQSISQIKKKWWLLEGPPADLLRTKDYDPLPPLPPSISPPVQGWPKISVIVISYNQVEYIRDCLESIVAQKYPNLEFIVVDGNSSDGSKEILKEYQEYISHLIIEPDRCQSDALNKGFRLATGEVMTWICSDDLLEERSLFTVGRTFAKNKVDLIAGGCRIVDAKGKNLFNHHNGLPFGQKVALSFGDLLSFLGVWAHGLYFYQPDIFFSRRIWEASGGYIKEHLHFAMDYDLFLRFAMAGACVIHIPNFLAIRRIHEKQKTQHTTKSYLPTVRNLLKEYKLLIEKSIRLAINKEYGTEKKEQKVI